MLIRQEIAFPVNPPVHPQQNVPRVCLVKNHIFKNSSRGGDDCGIGDPWGLVGLRSAGIGAPRRHAQAPRMS